MGSTGRSCCTRVLGAILGVVFGSFAAIGFGAFAQSAGFTFLEITVDPVLAVSLLFFGFIVGGIAGFVPAYKASKINIVDAIRK